MNVIKVFDEIPKFNLGKFYQYIDITHIFDVVDPSLHEIVHVMMRFLKDGYKYTTFTYKTYTVTSGQSTTRNIKFHYDCVIKDYELVKVENNILYTSCFGTLFEGDKAPENSIVQYGRELHSGYRPLIDNDVDRVVLRISQSDIIQICTGKGVHNINSTNHRRINKNIDKKFIIKT